MNDSIMDNEKLFAIKLAANEKETREKAFKKIRNYIKAKSMSETGDKFEEEDMIKIWKGLHYCMWMCDKLAVQQELGEKISQLVHCFNDDDEQTLLFIKVYFVTILREWVGIDKWRIDKFLGAMRNMLYESIAYLKHRKWNKGLMKQLLKIFLDYPLNINSDSCPDGVSYHFSDIYLEELGKFGDCLSQVKTVKMIQIFGKAMATSTKKPFVFHLFERFFKQIIECSDVGIDEEVEEELEEIVPFGIQACEKPDDSEYVLRFNYEKIADMLFKCGNIKTCLTRNKKLIFDLVKKFRALAKGVYPITEFNLPPLDDNRPKKKASKKKNKKNKKKSSDDIEMLNDDDNSE